MASADRPAPDTKPAPAPGTRRNPTQAATMTSTSTQAHDNMIFQQIRGWDVVDARVLDTLRTIPRERFTPAAWRSMAFADLPIPLGHGETMMKPVVEGRMLQALDLDADDQVLEIGTGSGFITACLAHLAGHVTSVDIRADFTAQAGARLREIGVGNADLVTAEAVRDWHPNRHFDAVVVTGAVVELPPRWQDWLAPEGRLFAIHGHPPILCASLWRNTGAGLTVRESLFDTCLPYLQHAAPSPDYTT